MFDRLKKFFSTEAPEATASTLSRFDSQLVSEWAQQQGLTYSDAVAAAVGGKPERRGDVFLLHGSVQGKSWRLECGAPSRDFIQGQELRGRSYLGVLDTVSVVVMNRPLKMALEKRAYSMYTDSLQTAIDSKLPEEMRWLAIYPEVGWANMPNMFFDRYSVLAAKREHAGAWINRALADVMMQWPPSGPSAEVPFVMMLLRGRCYLRMEYPQADLPTLQHVASIYRAACASALTNVAQNVDSDDTQS